jgi:hypothetical protein
VIRVDHLVGRTEGEPVRGYEDRDPGRLEDPPGLPEGAPGVGHVLDRLDREHPGEARRLKRQRPHVADPSLALLADEGTRVDVEADRLTRSQQLVAVADTAAEIENVSGR